MQKTLLLFVILFLTFEGVAQKKKKFDYLVTIQTSYGNIEMILFDETPKHKENFLKLSREGYYDSTLFHRVLDNFMIQGGDPNSKPSGDASKIGFGNPGYTVPAEFVAKYKHDRGMLAAARKGDRLNPSRASSGSQFYIVQSEKGAHHLDGAYTVFGKVLKGMSVVDSIAHQQVNAKGLPLEEIYILVNVEKMKVKKFSKLYNYTFE